MIIFRRNTHDSVSGEYKAELCDNPIAKLVFDEATCSVHMMTRDWMTLDQIIEAHARYDREFPFEKWGWSESQILSGLAMLVHFGLVEMSSDED